MVWIFFHQQTGTDFNGINYQHLPSDRNRIDDNSPSLPNRIFWNFSHKPHFHNAISHSVRKLENLVSSDDLDFFPINKPELFSTESTISIYHRTGTAWIILLSLPNRIFCNFSHKPHFHNAISHSVRNLKIGSVPMVWILFLSTNRNYFQRNRLSVSPPDRNRMKNPSISSKSNLLQLFSQATFPQCYIT